MPGRIFQKRFAKDPHSFNTTEEIDNFVKKKTGKKIKVKIVHPSIVTRRGFVFKIKKLNAGKRFNKALTG